MAMNDMMSAARELSFDLTLLVTYSYRSTTGDNGAVDEDGAVNSDRDEEGVEGGCHDRGHIQSLQHELMIQRSRNTTSILLLDILSSIKEIRISFSGNDGAIDYNMYISRV